MLVFSILYIYDRGSVFILANDTLAVFYFSVKLQYETNTFAYIRNQAQLNKQFHGITCNKCIKVPRGGEGGVCRKLGNLKKAI